LFFCFYHSLQLHDVLRWGTTLESLVLFFCFYHSLQLHDPLPMVASLEMISFFASSFVFPCPMIYFGMNYHHHLWNPCCIGRCRMYRFNASSWHQHSSQRRGIRSPPPPILLGIIVAKDHVMVH
jgi:hypothetical protein